MSTSLSGLAERDMQDLMGGLAPLERHFREGRILVTGATGWFGTWLLDALVAFDRAQKLGLSIVAISRDPSGFARRLPQLHAAPIITWIKVDVREALDSIDGVFTHIIHAANDSSAKPDERAPDKLFETIVDGTTNILKLAARCGNPRALLVSSGAVYGPQPADVERLNESCCGAPDVLDENADYSGGKRATESLGAMWHTTHGVPVLIARCFAFIGPHMPLDAHFAAGNFIGDATEGREITIGGDGSPLRSYQYMSDLVVWLLTILAIGRPLRPYNVGGDEVVSIVALAKTCARIAGDNACVRIRDHDGRQGRDYVPALDRARAELGLFNRVSLDDAVARTMEWSRRTQWPLAKSRRGSQC